MQFSVIIPTRNRPALFARALRSVLAQEGAAFEVIIVDDGSEDAHAAEYASLHVEAGERTHWFRLLRVARGHGQSYALNFGASQAVGAYLCFLDDDDEWTDAGYLARSAALSAGQEPDLLLADQAAFRAGVRETRPVWIEDLPQKLHGRATPEADGAYTLDAAALLLAHGFCHLNTTIVRREFFADIGGLDENSRYECDRDFYLRAIDRARSIRYRPGVVAHHHIPDPKAGASMSSAVSALEKHVFQIRVLDRAMLFARSAAVRAHGRTHKAYVLRRMAETLVAEGRIGLAADYASEALGLRFGWKWAAYTAVLRGRAAFSGRRS
jgi:glycosyltransferase involved in cell wall biosynthesis